MMPGCHSAASAMTLAMATMRNVRIFMVSSRGGDAVPRTMA